MGFFSKQLIDVIEWQEEPGQIAWRVPMEDNEIQVGAQLTVREGQMAAFLDKGQMADIFEPGLHTLDTDNLPIFTSLENWDKGFNSPFKSDVIFFSTRERPGLKWGTAQPITVRDPEFGAMRIRAFGTYTIKLEDVTKFYFSLFGTLAGMQVNELETQLRSVISTSLAATLGSGDTPFLDLAASQDKLSEKVRLAVDNALDQWGLSAPALMVENLSLPEAVQEAIDSGTSMRTLGDMSKYTQFKAAESLEIAAAQSGGVAGAGAGMGAGVALGQAMAGGLAGGQAATAAAVAPAAPAEDPLETIRKLHKLKEAGALSEDEFNAKKAELLAKIV